eukprot:gene5795-7997_t
MLCFVNEVILATIILLNVTVVLSFTFFSPYTSDINKPLSKINKFLSTPIGLTKFTGDSNMNPISFEVSIVNQGISKNKHAFVTTSLPCSTNSIDGDSNLLLPVIQIEYCPGCRWMLRSAWMAQELLLTFEEEIGEVSLKPCRSESGVFIIRLNNDIIWNRKDPKTEGFPEMKILKQIIRDNISPKKSLGHSDSKKMRLKS